MPTFCGDAPSSIWDGENISPCFEEPMFALTALGLVVLYGQLRVSLLPKHQSTPWFVVKLALTVVAALWTASSSVIRMAVLGEYVAPYQLLSGLVYTLAWGCSYFVICHDYKNTTSHTLSGLVGFWAWNVMISGWRFRTMSVTPSGTSPSDIPFGVISLLVATVLLIVGLVSRRDPLRESYLPVTEPQSGENAGKKDKKSRTSWGLLRDATPLLWPQDSFVLQVLFFLTLVVLALVRVVNLMMPLSYKMVVDKLTGDADSDPTFPVFLICLYAFLKFNTTLLADVRKIVWLRVSQNATKVISLKIFSHLHSLSLRYHLHRKTGEVLRVIDRGTNALSSLLSLLMFNIVPTILDILIACLYLFIALEIWFSLIVLFTLIAYIFVTVNITEWRTRFRREMIDKDNLKQEKAVDSILNFETVKYYANEGYEISRYDRYISEYQHANLVSDATLSLLNVAQNGVITGGLLLGLLLAGYRTGQGRMTVGEFVMVQGYFLQLFQPLSWLGTSYRMISQSLLDLEQMFSLLKTEPEVQDAKGSHDLVVKPGAPVSVRFEDVTFSYGPTHGNTLKGVTFEIPPGQTFAIVGSSGAGKSTIARLLFRFYDLQSGRILVDNQDISKVSQMSLRQNIGVVPQDTVLFNDTVEYNIGYGRTTADKDEIVEAARAAHIHEKILTFAEGYDTKVGERGLRLSGGEKQRVAIARTVLKNPALVILDEATSALDSQTERNIQDSLDTICQGRTTLIIAHRLSTVISADCILVLKDGVVAESGTHDELLNAGGLYMDMWTQQIKNNRGEKSATGPEQET